MKNQSWFTERIGSRVFSTELICKCDECKERLKKGLVIENEQDAKYLFDLQDEYKVVFNESPEINPQNP